MNKINSRTIFESFVISAILLLIFSADDVLGHLLLPRFGVWIEWVIRLSMCALIITGIYVLKVGPWVRFLTGLLFRSESAEHMQSVSTLMANAPEPFVVVDCAGKILSMNSAGEKAIGYRSDELVGRYFYDVGLLQAGDIPRAFKDIALLASRHAEIVIAEYSLVHQSGAILDFEIKASLMKNHDQITGIQVIFRDVSEQNRKLKNLAESGALQNKTIENLSVFKNIISLIPHHVFWKDRNSVYLGCNNNFAAAAGLKNPEEIIGKTDYDLAWKKEEADAYRKDDKRVMDSGQGLINFEEPQLRASGEQAVILTSKIPLRNANGEVEGVLGVYNDITQIKKDATKLKLQSAALESAYNAIAIVDRTGNISWVNHAFETLTGFSYNEAVGRNPRILKSGLTDAAVYKDLWETISGGKLWMGEMVNRRKNGTLYNEELTIAPVRGEDGAISHFIAIKQDISQRKQKEKELQIFRSLIDQASEALFIFDVQARRLMDVNEQACSVLGYSKGDLLSKTEAELDTIFGEAAILQKWLERGRQKKEFLTEGNVKPKGQPAYPAEISVKNSMIKNREYLVLSVRDVSEKKQLEELYRQSQKMEAVGLLAGGVAHDFNNLLTVINGNAELSLTELQKNDPRRKDFEEILNAGRMAASLTHQLLAFSRRQTMHPTVINPNELIGSMTGMLRRIIGEDVHLELVLDERTSSVRVDPTQVEQVLLNLAVNSRDAMPSGGQIIIGTKNVSLDPAARAQLGIKNESPDYVCVTFRDTGTGIPENIRSKIFDPFFTTKEKGKGSGLGLATCYGIIKQSGGAITVNSALGKGTEFEIFLPVVSVRQGQPEETKSETPNKSARKEKVLVVEDEPSVRRFVEKLLTRQGYVVLQAGNGNEALQLVQKNGVDHFDLLVTDVVMPEMGGRELASQLRQRRPALKVVYMSGYTNQSIVEEDLNAPNTEFIQKPFTSDEFVSRISKIIAL